MPKMLEITPKKGGINVDPTYALAISTPIIACEFSMPNLCGVECIRQG